MVFIRPTSRTQGKTGRVICQVTGGFGRGRKGDATRFCSRPWVRRKAKGERLKEKVRVSELITSSFAGINGCG
jgi:hypothetical protein